MNSNDPQLTQTLKSVSRSFYLSLRILPADMRPVMGLGYLLCRAADSIADTPTVSKATRLDLLNDLSDLFQRFPIEREKFKEFTDHLKSSIIAPNTPEGRLLDRFGDAVFLLKTYTHTDQLLVQEIVCGVIKGMIMDLKTFDDPASDEKNFTIKSFSKTEQLESYLRWIGGEPGRFWSNVCLNHLKNLKIKNPPSWIEHGVRFGTGLQLVNILKDIPQDLKIGRCYIPDELLKEQSLTPQELLDREAHIKFLPLFHRLIEDALERLGSGIDYLKEIPPSYFRLRAAVWWPLAIGVKTLELLREKYAVLNSAGPRKISRMAVWSTIGFSPLVLTSDKLVGFCFKRMREKASPF